MKSVTAPLALVLLLTASPIAGAQGSAPEQRTQRTASAPVAAPVSPAVAAKRRAAHADARVCLEFPTDMQVIACSEKYRWAKGG